MAVLSTAQRENLADSAYACPEKRLYPIHDAAHVRAALSRIADPSNDQCGKAKILAAARKFGIEVAASKAVETKALMPVLAKAMADDELEAWLGGKIPRRMLAIPYGGPIPSPHSEQGVDLDGQWFSKRTDLYGSYSQLKETRDRLVDWHHSYAPLGERGGDPMGKMNHVALGKAVLDDEDAEEGRWADFWVNEGLRKLSLIRRLAERGAQLFASAQPVVPGKADPLTGEITYFPMHMMTVTTSPQNTLAVVTPKALLTELDSVELSVSPALRGLLTELDALGAELPNRFRVGGGEAAVKAGSVSISDALGPWEALRDALRKDQP